MLRRYQDAMEDFDKAIKIKPDYANAYFYKSIIQLQQGDYLSGWKNYEWRWKTSDFPSPKRDFKQPYWDGKKSLTNKVILIHGEQGLGDHILFIRYINLIKPIASKVLLEVDKKLVKLFKESEIIENIYERGERLPEFDYHCPLLSLPLKFSTTIENIPSKNQYIFPKSSRVKKWEKFFDKQKFNVGIAWITNKITQVHGRSISLNNFKEISSLKKTQLYSLQIYEAENEIKKKDPNLNLKLFNKNFDQEAPFIDTAAVIKNLDLVISIDTSIAHLAGALGCKTYLLLSDKPHWTWMLDKPNTHWYSSMKIYRKSRINNWTNIFDNIKSDIVKIKK